MDEDTTEPDPYATDAFGQIISNHSREELLKLRQVGIESHTFYMTISLMFNYLLGSI